MNLGGSLLQYLEEMTYSDSAPHAEALKMATKFAQSSNSNALIVRRFDPRTQQHDYRAIPPGEDIPGEYDIWAEVNARGKLHRITGMY